jgi:hypothetical protein
MKTTLPITGYGMMAEAHWREHRPNMVRELEAQGKLEAALYEAQERTLDELLALEDKLTAQGLTTDQASRQAWEMVRENYIILPAEEDDE